MNIETKEVSLGFEQKDREIQAKEYESFGWEYTQDVRRGRSHKSIMVRNKDIPHYYEIIELEDRYFKLKAKKKHYTPVNDDPLNYILMFIMLILFVVPLVLYLLFKGNQKKRIREYNNNLQTQMDELANKAKQLMQDK